MNIELLKKLGNIDQLAGIRETKMLRGRVKIFNWQNFITRPAYGFP